MVAMKLLMNMMIMNGLALHHAAKKKRINVWQLNHVIIYLHKVGTFLSRYTSVGHFIYSSAKRRLVRNLFRIRGGCVNAFLRLKVGWRVPRYKKYKSDSPDDLWWLVGGLWLSRAKKKEQIAVFFWKGTSDKCDELLNLIMRRSTGGRRAKGHNRKLDRSLSKVNVNSFYYKLIWNAFLEQGLGHTLHP